MLTLHEIQTTASRQPAVNRRATPCDLDGVALAGLHYQAALERYADGRISFDAVVSACEALALASRARRRRYHLLQRKAG